MDGYEEILDEVEDEEEQGQDVSDSQLDSYEQTLPGTKEKSDIYAWFWRVIRLKEPFRLVRAGNLTYDEIGANKVSVRDSMNLAKLGHIFHHKKFATYWEDVAAITSATSMAKKGWFMDLSISQKRVRERARTGSPFAGKKWRLFNKKEAQQAEQ